MPLSDTQYAQLNLFFNQSDFTERGAVITDLDGTAIHEYDGRYSIPQSVELGLEKIYELGRPVILNSLRFPLSVIRTFAKEWYKISNNPIPTVLLNGSQLGFIIQNGEGSFHFEEIQSFPLKEKEILDVMRIVNDFMQRREDELLVFYYPGDWKKGEIIWTPVPERIEHIKEKYKSSSQVYNSDVAKLEADLLSEPLCMVFLLIDLPEDKLMAYQHTKKKNFFTSEGVDKLYGAEKIAELLDFDLKHSLGAGDSEMDTFLKGVGQAVHVGNPFLNLQGLLPPIRVQGSSGLGDLLFSLSALQKNALY